MAIQMRRGLRKDFNPAKMLPGEWAVSIDSSTSNQIVWMCFAPGVVKRIGTFEDLEAELDPYKEAVESYAEDAAGSASLASASAENAESYAEQAQTDSLAATSAAETATSAAETAVTAAGTATTAAGAAEASAQTASDAEISINQSMDEATRLIGEVETKAQAIIDAESNAEEYAEAAAGSASAASASALAASTSEDHANECSDSRCNCCCYKYRTELFHCCACSTVKSIPAEPEDEYTQSTHGDVVAGECVYLCNLTGLVLNELTDTGSEDSSTDESADTTYHVDAVRTCEIVESHF